MAKKRSVFVIQQVSAKSMPPMNMKLQRLWNPNSLRPKDSSSDFGNGPPFRISNKFHRRFFSKLETHLSECYDSGEFRRSARISQLDARKAQQAKSRKDSNGTINSGMAQDQVTRQNSNQKPGRKRKTRPVNHLLDNDIENQVQKASTLSDGDHHTTAVDMSSTMAMPETKTLGLLLDRLKRRDSHRIFAEPVNGEEVEGYYDVIEEPMDFSTITQKLIEGSYKALKEFEHDIFLVYNNAMCFNASNTIYYKQAHAIKELANKLFQTLKSDPTSFEAECLKRTERTGRRTKAVPRSPNSRYCNKITGCRDERRSENVEVQPRQTYSAKTSSINENEALLTQVYNSLQKLEPVKENKTGYGKSLTQFASNLGPTAQMIAQRKLGSGIAETSNLTATLNCHLQAPNNQIPSVASAHENITTAPSLKFPGISAGCHMLSGTKLDNHSTLNGGNASRVDTMDIYDVLRGGIAQTSSTMKALDDICGRIVQAPNNINPAATPAGKTITVPPSVKLLGPSGGRELDILNGILSEQKTPMVDSVNKFDFINGQMTQVNRTNENLGNMRGKMMVQTMSSGFDMGTALQKCICASGHENLNFPVEWNTENKPNKFSFVKMMLDAIVDSPDHSSKVVSSGSKVQESVPARYSCPSSSSWQWPVQTMPGGSSRSQPISFIPEVNPHNLGGVHQLQVMQDREGPSSRGSIEQGGQVNWLKLNIEGGSSGAQAFGSMQGLDSNYLSGVHHIQATADNKAGPSHGGRIMPGGQVPNWLQLTGLGADAGGTSHGSSINGGQLSNWFKLTDLGPQPSPNDWFQKQGRSFTEAELLFQAEPWQQQRWATTPNMYNYEKYATSGQGKLRIGAPADNLQKQPSQDSCFPQWAFHP